jgi:peptidoglycan/xylan/chitin deacetylase (PgdA/CDA1 family)
MKEIMRLAILSIVSIHLLACSTGIPQSASPQTTASADSPVSVDETSIKRKKIDSYYTEVKTSRPIVAMTFDDGPHKTLTPRLLDILKERGIKATFFVVGRNVVEYPDIAKRIVDEGHEIANHTWSHPWLTRLSDTSVRTQLQRTSDAVEKITGKKPAMFRPPYGALTKRQRTWIFKDFGYPEVLWTVDPLDWKRPGVSVVTNRIVEGASPGAIILAHDIHESTVDAMPGTLDQLLAKGFEFATVSELIAMEEVPTPTPSPTAQSMPEKEMTQGESTASHPPELVNSQKKRQKSK